MTAAAVIAAVPRAGGIEAWGAEMTGLRDVDGPEREVGRSEGVTTPPDKRGRLVTRLVD